MKTPFVRGMAFIACISNVQAMDSHMNPTSNNETTNEASQGRICWNQNLSVAINALQKTILDFLTDENGSRININSLTDEKIRDLGEEMCQTLAKRNCAPILHNLAPDLALEAVLLPQELHEFGLKKILYLFEGFEKIGAKELERYNASFS